MASRALTPSGKTPLSDRISMFEQKKQQSFDGGHPSPATPGKVQLAKKPVSTSKNFSAIKNQFDSGSGTMSPTAPSPPSSARNSLTSFSLSGPFVNKLNETPVPAARSIQKQETLVTTVDTPKQTPTKLGSKSPVSVRGPSPTKTVLTKQTFTSIQRTVELKTDSNKVVLEVDDTDSFNGNKKKSLDNLNELNLNNKLKSSKEKDDSLDVAAPSPEILTSDLDNVKSLKTTTNLNLKNFSSSTSGVTSPPAEVRTSYWSSQALQNDNAQRISEVLKLDLDLKDGKNGTSRKEFDELSSAGSNDDDVSTLKRQKHDLELRLKEEEEEIDDLASQVQLLEQSKIKLEMAMTNLKKEHRREMALKEEELEDARAATQKKVKVLEQQLEHEHEERLNFVREKHELETKLMNLKEFASRSADAEQVGKLKKDLRRMKALLKDAQLMVERSKSESSNKVVLRQLKNQLEDAEFAKTATLKAKQNMELELSDVQSQLDDVLRCKSELEDRLLRMSREKADLSTQLDDSEEELQEVMKKYKATVAQLSVYQITIQEQTNRIADCEGEKNNLKEQVAELLMRIESLEGETILNVHQSRMELKIKELESKLELEQTTRGRMETQIYRLKDAIEKLNSECDMLRNKDASSQDLTRKLQQQLRQIREDYAEAQQKETEANSKKNELEKQLELAEAETVLAKNDLKLSLKRVEDLQTAINGEMDSESDSANSDCDSDTSEDGTSRFFSHQRGSLISREADRNHRDKRSLMSMDRTSEDHDFHLSDGSLALEESVA